MAIQMAFLYFHQRAFLRGYLESRLGRSVKLALLLIKQGESKIDNAAIADVTELPIDAIQVLEKLPDDYLSDLEDYSEVFDVNSEMLSEWYDKVWVEGLRACVHRFFKERFDPLPSWATKKLDEADEKDLAYWLREGGRYNNLEALLLGCDMADQILMCEPPHWETKAFLKGIRRSLRLQILEKFAEVPFWLDEQMAEASYEELSELAIRLLDAKTLCDLFPGAEVPPQN